MQPAYSLEQGKEFSGRDARGQITGYEADYTKPGVRDGLIRVASKAVVFASPAAAHAFLKVTYAHPPAGGAPFTRARTSWRLGDESRLYLQSATGSVSGVRLAVYLVLWRSGRILGSLNGGGIAGTFSPSEVVALARKQQARMRAARG
jgi:hypothetical protein